MKKNKTVKKVKRATSKRAKVGKLKNRFSGLGVCAAKSAPDGERQAQRDFDAEQRLEGLKALRATWQAFTGKKTQNVKSYLRNLDANIQETAKACTWIK